MIRGGAEIRIGMNEICASFPAASTEPATIGVPGTRRREIRSEVVRVQQVLHTDVKFDVLADRSPKREVDLGERRLKIRVVPAFVVGAERSERSVAPGVGELPVPFEIRQARRDTRRGDAVPADLHVIDREAAPPLYSDAGNPDTMERSAAALRLKPSPASGA